MKNDREFMEQMNSLGIVLPEIEIDNWGNYDNKLTMSERRSLRKLLRPYGSLISYDVNYLKR